MNELERLQKENEQLREREKAETLKHCSVTPITREMIINDDFANIQNLIMRAYPKL